MKKIWYAVKAKGVTLDDMSILTMAKTRKMAKYAIEQWNNGKKWEEMSGEMEVVKVYLSAKRGGVKNDTESRTDRTR